MMYSKKIFALLLERAKGERSWRRFADDCGISYVQIRKLSICAQENPPRPKLIEKLAAHSEGVTAEDYMFAAGYTHENRQRDELWEKISELSADRRRFVEDLVNYLSKKK